MDTRPELDRPNISLATTPATPWQTRLAFSIVAVLFVGFTVAAPFAAIMIEVGYRFASRLPLIFLCACRPPALSHSRGAIIEFTMVGMLNKRVLGIDPCLVLSEYFKRGFGWVRTKRRLSGFHCTPVYINGAERRAVFDLTDVIQGVAKHSQVLIRDKRIQIKVL